MGSLVALRLAPLELEFTAVNPELTAVNPPDVGACARGGASSIGVSRSVLTPPIVACKASEALRAGESPRTLIGVLTLDRLTGVCPGLGVNGPPYSCSSC